MALTDAELTTQVNTLATATDSNPKMVFKKGSLNKGLNPEFFGSGNSTKIVTAMNTLYEIANGASATANNVFNQVDGVLGASGSEGSARVETMKEQLGAESLVAAVLVLSDKINNLPEGGGSGGGLTVTILDEPTTDEDDGEETVTCEHVYADGKCTLCGEDEPTEP